MKSDEGSAPHLSHCSASTPTRWLGAGFNNDPDDRMDLDYLLWCVLHNIWRKNKSSKKRFWLRLDQKKIKAKVFQCCKSWRRSRGQVCQTVKPAMWDKEEKKQRCGFAFSEESDRIKIVIRKNKNTTIKNQTQNKNTTTDTFLQNSIDIRHFVLLFGKAS